MLEHRKHQSPCPHCVAEVIAGLDVYDLAVSIPGYQANRKCVNKRHLVVHIGDLFAAFDPGFDRQAFEEACGEGAEPGKVY